MADKPIVITENKSSSLNLQAEKTFSLKKPSQQAVNYFNAQNLLNKNQTTGLARDAIANKISSAVLLSTTTTFSSKTIPLPSFKLPSAGSLIKPVNLVKVTPWVAVASSVFSMEPLGFTAKEEKNIIDNLRVQRSRLSEKDAKLIGLPTTFPIQQQAKPMGGFEAYQGNKYNKLESPTSVSPQIHSTQLPINNDLPTAGIMTSKQSEADERERKVDQYLIDKGHKVEVNPREGVDGAGRQGDRYIDGKLTEYKSIHNVKNATSDGISSAISNRAMKARGQAPNIIIDTREQVGMTEEIAERGIVRALNADNVVSPTKKIKEIRVIGNGFDITKVRLK